MPIYLTLVKLVICNLATLWLLGQQNLERALIEFDTGTCINRGRMTDCFTQDLPGQGIKLLDANPERIGCSEDTLVDTYFDSYKNAPSGLATIGARLSNSLECNSESSRRRSAAQLASVRKALPLPPTQVSPPQRSVTKGRIIITITSDSETYVIVNITGYTGAQDIRERILSKLHIPDDLYSSYDIYRTELGEIAIGDALDDDQLLVDCQRFGDGKGTLKFLAQRSTNPPLRILSSLSKSPVYHFVPASGATTTPPHISGYTGRAHDTDSNCDPTKAAAEFNTANASLEADSLEAKNYHATAAIQRMVSTEGGLETATPSIPTAPIRSVSQSIVPVAGPQPAYIQRQPEIISRDLGAAVEIEEDSETDEDDGVLWQISKQNSTPPATGIAAGITATEPLVRGVATRPKGFQLRVDVSRPSSHPDSSPSPTQDISMSGKSIRGVAAKLNKMLKPINAAKAQQPPLDNSATYIPESNFEITQLNTVIPVSDFFKESKESVTPDAETTASVPDNLSVVHPSKMFVHEMIEHLMHFGCPDLTQLIDPDGYSKYPISTGGFGDVFRAKLNDGTPVAIKVWRSRALEGELGKAGKRAMREIYHWSQLNHENIQQLLGVVVLNARLGMVSKWMEINLQEYLQQNPLVDGYPLCIQVAKGVEYIHNRNMIHGDLKAINILVSSDHKLKLTNFDYSIMAESIVFSQTTRMGGGTLRWMAPELVLDFEGNQQRNKETDIYALGMTFLETIGRVVPYYPQCKTDGSVFHALTQKRFPQRDSSFFGSDQRGDRMWALLMRCWDHDPSARPTAAKVTIFLQTLARDIPYPSEMSVHEMIEYLMHIGCRDLIQPIDPNGYSKSYMATGGFADIYKGKLNDGTPVAVKVWRSRALNEELGKCGKRAMREIYNWSQLDHENIQQLLGVVVFDGRLGMVSKWMERGNLQEYLQRNPSVDSYPLCIQVAKGVEYIHNRNMIHGDLKAINILVSSDHKLKLTDFDYSIMAGSTVFSQTTRMGGGTPRWMAPELVLDSEGNHQRNKETDIYALGMTFLETISRVIPYFLQCKTDVNVLNALYQKRFPRRDSYFFGSDQRGDRMWALMMRCWDYDPAARPTAAEVTVLLQTLVRETERGNSI